MYIELEPLMALVAGVAVLAFPKLLNYIVGIYLVALGLLGLVR